MYKDKEKQKEVQREWVRQKRAKGSTEGLLLPEGSTTPAIIRALVDPKKRAMLEYISEDLNRKHMGDLLRYGVYGPDFEVIGQLLECTERR